MKNKPFPIFGMITDTHSKEQNYIFIEGIFEQFISHLAKINCKLAIHGGDFVQERFPEGPLETLDSVLSCVKKFHKNGIELQAIAGNHDKTDLTSPKSYISLFKNCTKTFKLHEEFGFFNLNDEIRISFVPYFKEGESYLSRLVDLIDDIKQDNKIKKRKTILVTHISVTGAKNNDGSFVENDIEKEYFDFFDLVLVGHYHNRNRLNSKIWYIGSAFQANHGEDDLKGFCVVYSDLSIKFVKTEFPKYIKLKIDINNREDLSEKIKEYENTEDNIRFLITGSQADLDSFDKTILMKSGIDIRYENNVELFTPFDEIEAVDVFDKKSLLKCWIEYSKKVNLSSTEKTKGLELLQELK